MCNLTKTHVTCVIYYSYYFIQKHLDLDFFFAINWIYVGFVSEIMLEWILQLIFCRCGSGLFQIQNSDPESVAQVWFRSSGEGSNVLFLVWKCCEVEAGSRDDSSRLGLTSDILVWSVSSRCIEASVAAACYLRGWHVVKVRASPRRVGVYVHEYMGKSKGVVLLCESRVLTRHTVTWYPSSELM